jgi:hypothetical protein
VLYVKIRAKVSVVIPQTRHEFIQKALIVEEEIQRSSEQGSSETRGAGVTWCIEISNTS